MTEAVGKAGSMAILMLAQVLVLSLWFISAATMPGMLAEVAISPARQAALFSLHLLTYLEEAGAKAP